MTRDIADVNATTQKSERLRWGRIIAGAFLLELLLVIALVPPLQILGPEKVIPFAYPAVFTLGFVVAWWLLRKVPHRTVIHGALIGIVATIIYVLLCFTNPDGIKAIIDMYGLVGFILGNGLRVLGCTAGGYALRTRVPM